MGAHESVLSGEVLAGLDPQPGQVILDGTLGWGGHARKILERIGPQGRLIGMDKDEDAVEAAKIQLAEFGDRVTVIRDDFKNVQEALEKAGVNRIHGALLDLGVSSPQLDRAERGFSLSKNGPLDMRMDVRQALTAEEVVNRYSEEKLRELIWAYGEERFARRIAQAIVRVRTKNRLRTTSELEAVVFHAVPASYRHGRIHPATRVFQAIRIEVNGELDSLKIFLESILNPLEQKGKVAIVSFHSLEDRIVKNAFREFKHRKWGNVLTKKPIIASEAELSANPRSRSAKLRIFEKRSEEKTR